MPHINKLIKYQFHGTAAQDTPAPTPTLKMMTTADFNSAYSADDGK